MENAPAQPRTRHDPQAMVGEIRGLVAQVQSPFVRALLFSFLDDPELGPLFLRAPAAKSIHHAFLGGLCEHTLSVLQLGWRICDHYPQLDRDLITAGALLHDFGKTRELSAEPGFDYTDEGKLVGHLLLTCQLIREKAAQIDGFPRELEWQITHLVAAHHGRLEYGSPKEAVTLEALVVHSLDELDSRMSSFGQLLEGAVGRWTDRKNRYGREFLRTAPGLGDRTAPASGDPLARGAGQAPAGDSRRFTGAGVYREEG